MNKIFITMLLSIAALDASALGRLADVEVLDRSTGETLPVYRFRGEYWVAGTPGDRYSLVIRNQRNERLLAVTAVDGVNVITGETGAWAESGYVYGAGEAYAIEGWRKSNQEIADFEFTDSHSSYAERTGRPANVGVIGVALFLERAPAAPVAQYAPRREAAQDETAQGRAALDDAASNSAAAAAAPRLAENAANELRESQTASSQAFPSPAAKLGTGHGAREYSAVSFTQFNRMSGNPNEVVQIRYDSLTNLVAMGVVRPQRRPWNAPNPFPDSALSQYAPDPPSNLPRNR